jgi:hypothetical protein
VICFECKDNLERDRTIYWRTDLTFGAWLIHRIGHTSTDLISFLVLRVGILDAAEDGGLIFWRWDFWNGTMRREYQRITERWATAGGRRAGPSPRSCAAP